MLAYLEGAAGIASSHCPTAISDEKKKWKKWKKKIEKKGKKKIDSLKLCDAIVPLIIRVIFSL